MSEVIALKPGGRLDRGSLAQLANDDRLEHFMVVCIWKDGDCTAGWTGGMEHRDLVFGAAALQDEVQSQVFGRDPE